jgi:hypothetical protein
MIRRWTLLCALWLVAACNSVFYVTMNYFDDCFPEE